MYPSTALLVMGNVSVYSILSILSQSLFAACLVAKVRVLSYLR